ncbi:hypothetical protein PLICRDRAFT_46117 [Plicaturopsis crispa FD-325 SS-3]|uniref:S-adenosyl-L-methionine-dependent methyltransferase n=1 Tax=Plicaturopsis crispa FD-325 SS-3 TaxID=944288 RepID=A0A0C9T7Z9_PLICR|nr:hypothetical protein PLICRDRAFT_46117 [Plicaturopsis crispa FD-325 SS-3]
MWRLLNGPPGLYPGALAPLVEAQLKIDASHQKRVLDIGSGSGIWAVEIAETFPHVDVVGFDLAKNKYETLPTNCRFDRGNVELGIPQYRGLFDVVHCRSVAAHLTDPIGLLKSIGESLKPGGLLLLVDGSYNVYGSQKQPLLPILPPFDSPRPPVHEQTTHSYFRGWMEIWKDLAGNGIIPATKSADDIIKDDGQFADDVRTIDLYGPVGWPGHDGTEQELGAILKQNLTEFVQASKPAFLKTGGFSSEVLGEWMLAIDEETDVGHIYTFWTASAGFKKP